MASGLGLLFLLSLLLPLLWPTEFHFEAHIDYRMAKDAVIIKLHFNQYPHSACL